LKYSKDKEGIINCDLTLKQCDKDWGELKVTGNPHNRFCLDCERTVHRVDNPEDLRSIIKEGKCVAYFMEKEQPLVGLITFPSYFKDRDEDDFPF